MKAYSQKEVAELYCISVKSLKTWLKPFEGEIGPKCGRYYTPRQIKVIVEKLGMPEKISLEKHKE